MSLSRPVLFRLVLGTAVFVSACGKHDSLTGASNGADGSATPKTANDANAAHPASGFDEPIARAYLDFIAKTSPETASMLGLHDHDDLLDDRSIEGLAANETIARALLTRLETDSSFTQGADLELVKRTLRVELRWDEERKPQLFSPGFYVRPLSTLYAMTARDYAPKEERAKNAILRIEKLPALAALGKKQLTTPPKVFTQIGIEEAKGAKSFLEDERVALKAALPSEASRIDAAVDHAISAYAEYARFLEKEVLPRSSGNFRAGKPFFEFLLHEDLSLKESSDELHALGKRIFDETEAELLRVAQSIDPKATTWAEVVGKQKSHHPKAGELLASYAREVARARAFLVEKGVVSFPQGEHCEVVDTPSFQRSTTTAAYEEPAPFDRVTQGLFFVTPVDLTKSKSVQEEMLRENDFGDIVDTVVHEAYPGHHLQLSFARAHPSMVRRAVDSSLFAEGWALYSEELMNELGYYKKEERLMQLEWTLVRAARVLIDLGLHTESMTVEEAIDLLVKRVHLERPTATAEVHRYTTSPTQPLTYLVGRETIFRLRERYKKREGDKFTLKRFHDELLSHGTIPLAFVEREMFDTP